MSKTNIKQHVKIYLLLFVSVIFAFFGIYTLSFQPIVQAANKNSFSFYYSGKDSPANQEIANKCFYQNGGAGKFKIDSSECKAFLPSTSILVRDGLMGQDIVVPYSPDITRAFGNDNGEPFYSLTYYCKDSRPTFTKPRDPQREGDQYREVRYTVGLSFDRSLYVVGISNVQWHLPPLPGDPTREELYNQEERGHSPDNLDDDQGDLRNALPQPCRPNFTGKIDPVWCGKLWSETTGNDPGCSAFSSLMNRANQQSPSTGSSGGGNGTFSEDGPDTCSGSGLSWIICPVIELGQSSSETVFGIIEPLLRDIPVSTDPDNGGYRAWQGFRVIGNTVLIGSMLLLVYGMIRGGGR